MCDVLVWELTSVRVRVLVALDVAAGLGHGGVDLSLVLQVLAHVECCTSASGLLQPRVAVDGPVELLLEHHTVQQLHSEPVLSGDLAGHGDRRSGGRQDKTMIEWVVHQHRQTAPANTSVE